MRRSNIKPLPETVKSSVRSGILVFDLTRVVEELIFNSLDAGATKVSVAVGVGTGYINVADNGSGITRDGLVLLGERYATSKFDHLVDMDTATGSFGFRGEALGSISDVSLLEIVTKAHGRPNGYRKVMKGCKCLYLGIDDARQDAGTTVVVRDLFYNQPVRRKQLQSSPKKVLHSLKECVLRFALVHLKVSFKVVDIESEDELLCTHPSSSPLPLLMSGFGIEISSSLHEFSESDGILKLSGYISGPCEAFSGKAVQYVYINSRFVCKGPIHKLLSQLAAKFIRLDLCTANNGYYSGKRCRVQTHPSYILNLGCPRSLYDLTFEPSKTSAEFKDWDPILSFLEKAITNFWNNNVSYGNCLSHGADTLENDDMWKEGGNTFRAEEDVAADCGMKRKRYRTQFRQASLDLRSPQTKMLIKEFKHLSPGRSNRVSSLKSSRKTLEFDEHQVGTGFACETNYSFQLHDGVLSPCRDTVVDQENCRNLETLDGKVSSAEDYFLENNFTTERSNEHVDRIIGTGCNDVSLKLDVDVSDILTSSGGLSADCFEVGNDLEEINENLKEEKSFLQSCSSRRNLLSDRAFSASDKGFEFQFNRFRNREKWLGHVDRVDIGEVDDSRQIFESWQDERASIWSSPRLITQHDFCTGPEITARDSTQLFPITGECFDEDRDLQPDSDDHFRECGSRHVSFKSKWSCLTPNPSLNTIVREAEHFIDEDVLEKNFKISSYDYSANREDKDCISGYGSMRNNFGWGNYSASRCMESGLKDYGSSQGDICNFHVDNLDYDLFPKCLDEYSDEIKWLGLEACGKIRSMTGAEPSHCISSAVCADEDKDRRAQISCHEKAYGKRPRRSHSAPPLYRGKKKFLASNSGLNMEAGNTQIATTYDAPTLKGTCNMKQHKQSSGYYLSSKPQSVLDSINDSRLDTRTTNMKKVPNCEMQTGAQDLHINMDFEDYTSKKSRDSLASGIKWRSSCPTASGEKLNNLYNKGANILDISSGILHLAGDSLVPKSVSKDCLEGAKVLQQIDKKYIPVVGDGVLAIIDQHAADERIQLEELRQKVLYGDMKTITYLDVEQELVLPEIGHQLLHNYAEQIQNWGWICNINTQSSRSFKKNLKLLRRQPSAATLVAVPCILGVSLTDADLLEFLQQLADTDGSSAIPPSVLRVLNFKACRGAIMFGDALLPSECSLIVEELKKTSLCFQCAHGRPTTVPLVNLELLHKQIAKLGLQSSGSNELWNGLRRHEATLERAAQRLNSTGGQC